jgi:hypothetical protein
MKEGKRASTFIDLTNKDTHAELDPCLEYHFGGGSGGGNRHFFSPLNMLRGERKKERSKILNTDDTSSVRAARLDLFFKVGRLPQSRSGGRFCLSTGSNEHDWTSLEVQPHSSQL